MITLLDESILIGGQMYKSLKADFEGLRSLVTCKICIKLLYEPYVTSCGHTYCYSVSGYLWLGSNYMLTRFLVSLKLVYQQPGKENLP